MKRVRGSLALVEIANTSLFLFLYNLIKVKQESIKKNAEILKLFLPLFDGINRYPFQEFLRHRDFGIDWEEFKKEIDQRKGEYEELTEIDMNEEEEEEEIEEVEVEERRKNFEVEDHRIIRSKLLEYFIVKRYATELEHLTLSEILTSQKFCNVNLTTKGDKHQTVFRTFQEVLILKSPFFYRMIKFGGMESELVKATGTLKLEYLNKFMFCLMHHFYFLGRIPLKSGFLLKRFNKKLSTGNLMINFDNNSNFLIGLFRLLNYCDMYEDKDLESAVYKTFNCVFRKFESRLKMINMIVSHGYLLESEKVQNQFCKNLCEICSNSVMMNNDKNEDGLVVTSSKMVVVPPNSNSDYRGFDEVMMKKYIKESHRKYSVDVSIRKWRKRFMKAKRENKLVKKEIEQMKKKIEEVEKKKKKKK